MTAAVHLVQLSDDELTALRTLPDLVKALLGHKDTAAQPAERLESPREVARRLRLNVRAVRAAIDRGELPATRRPGRGGRVACWILPGDADRVLGVQS